MEVEAVEVVEFGLERGFHQENELDVAEAEYNSSETEHLEDELECNCPVKDLEEQ